MARPLLLAVDNDLERLKLVRQELVNRYRRDYRVVCVSTASEGLRLLDDAVRTGVKWLLFSQTYGFRRKQGQDFSRKRARGIHMQSVWL